MKDHRDQHMKDEGTTFIASEECRALPVKDFRYTTYRSTKTVLLIEDEVEISRSLAIRLTSEGFDVVTASDGVEGLEKIVVEEPDVVILDLRLPRMPGFKLLHHLRMTPGLMEVPIIILTGDPDPWVEEKARQWGIYRVYRKPTRPTKIVHAIRDLLE